MSRLPALVSDGLSRLTAARLRAVLLVSGGAVMTSDPYRYMMKVNKG